MTRYRIGWFAEWVEGPLQHERTFRFLWHARLWRWALQRIAGQGRWFFVIKE